MQDYISISMLNDFIFCPYSIYLHNVYMESDEGLYHAAPQTKGRYADEATDEKTSSSRSNDILALPVYSERFRLMGKIDLYRKDEKKLIERKYKLNRIFRGQIYQLWAQMFCLQEMGFEVHQLAFYEISTRKTIPVQMPKEEDIKGFEEFIEHFHNYNPEEEIELNPNKCLHCIYCNLCDKTEVENVYA